MGAVGRGRCLKAACHSLRGKLAGSDAASRTITERPAHGTMASSGEVGTPFRSEDRDCHLQVVRHPTARAEIPLALNAEFS